MVNLVNTECSDHHACECVVWKRHTILLWNNCISIILLSIVIVILCLLFKSLELHPGCWWWKIDLSSVSDLHVNGIYLLSLLTAFDNMKTTTGCEGSWYLLSSWSWERRQKRTPWRWSGWPWLGARPRFSGAETGWCEPLERRGSRAPPSRSERRKCTWWWSAPVRRKREYQVHRLTRKGKTEVQCIPLVFDSMF